MIKKSSKTNPIITMKIKKEFGEYIIIKKKQKKKSKILKNYLKS